ncbi:MAG: twin-arginine translocase TatA/TatE family subunit [Chloroflexota bacterium]|nr:twin-arginine translocase TatA/TatE family subunit [Chloroflexota bacterium]
MEILGIGPGEFVLILIVLLVVVGPERLPGLARQAGGFMVRARNWLQTSPDAALVMRARAEIEAELASIKNSLMEVQVVRDEVMDAARQLGDSVGSIAPPKFDINSLANSPAEQTIAANGQLIPAGETSGLVLPDGTNATSTRLDQRSTLELPDGSSVPIHPSAEVQPTNGLANSVGYSNLRQAPTVADSATPALGELESINIRLQAIMADMWALQQQLKQHGALDESWQPPSFEVQLNAQATAPLAGGEISTEPLLPEAPIEDPVVLAARKRLEELTPMRVAHHAPPVVEQVPTDSAISAAVGEAAEVVALEASATATSTELAPLIDPLTAPAPKARKRRATPAADQNATTEIPVVGTPVAKTRKRRTPATSPAIRRDSAEHTDEAESVTTEKAS